MSGVPQEDWKECVCEGMKAIACTLYNQENWGDWSTLYEQGIAERRLGENRIIQSLM